MISVCMIVKNEEKNIKNCLSKVVNFVDEIIIVDTGSTDNTKEFAREFTDKIYDFKWDENFSNARNFSISKASKDWILVLDGDEFVKDFSRCNIDKFINDSSNINKVGRMQRINEIEDTKGNKENIERINRFFNKKYFYYEGIIHEQIVAKDGIIYESENIDITINHTGYTKEEIKRTDKIKRNIDLLEISLENNLQDPYLNYQKGKSYHLLKDYKNSALYFEKSLSIGLDFNLEYVEDLVETYGYSLINSSRYKEALILENWIEIYIKSPDFHFTMGLIYMNNGKFTQAIESFLECTKLPNPKIVGINTYISYYNIGVIYDLLEFKEKAREYYLLCGDYHLAKEANIFP